MRVRILAWVLFPLLIGLAGYSIHSIAWGRHWAIFAKSRPVLECPQLLELGERELGEVALGRFTLKNRGGGTLVIDQVTSSCACAGLEREQDGELVRLQSLRLDSGESADLVIRVLVQGTPGNSAENIVQFHTNDPMRSVTGIRVVIAKVNAGVTSVPTSIVFGRVAVGAEAKEVVQLFDAADPPRRIERVTSHSPDRVSTRLIQPTADEVASASGTHGTLIGLVEATAISHTAGPLYADVEVHLAGQNRPPTQISVSARFVGAIELRPSMIVLPRASNKGLVFVGESLCECSIGEIVEVKVDSNVDDIKITVESVEGNGGQRLIRAEWKPADQMRSRLPKNASIRCRAILKDDEVSFDIPVLCLGAGI
jgi:hypothetical protein